MITLVQPTLNDSAVLQRCASTIKCINIHNYPYIIADGGSTDGTLSLAMQYADEVISSPPGLVNQLLSATQLVSSPYIFLVESDLDYSQIKLEELQLLFSSPTIGVIQCTKRRKTAGNFWERNTAKSLWLESILYKHTPVASGASLWRTSLFREALLACKGGNGYSYDTFMSDYVYQSGMKVLVSDLTAYETKSLSFQDVYKRYRNYGHGDSVYFWKNTKYWSIKRRIKSLFHPLSKIFGLFNYMTAQSVCDIELIVFTTLTSLVRSISFHYYLFFNNSTIPF
jgi:glycosyltransferase involved in cell wall biosynthesis